MNTSPSPTAIAWAAELIAWSPEPHSRLTVRPATSTGKSGEQERHPRDVAVVLARLVRAAEDDVLDEAGSMPARSTSRAQDGAPRGRPAGRWPARRRSGRWASGPPRRSRPRGRDDSESRCHAPIVAARGDVRRSLVELARGPRQQSQARRGHAGWPAPSRSARSMSSWVATPSSTAYRASVGDGVAGSAREIRVGERCSSDGASAELLGPRRRRLAVRVPVEPAAGLAARAARLDHEPLPGSATAGAARAGRGPPRRPLRRRT